jgi:hypothetical protein
VVVVVAVVAVGAAVAIVVVVVVVVSIAAVVVAAVVVVVVVGFHFQFPIYSHTGVITSSTLPVTSNFHEKRLCVYSQVTYLPNITN